MSKLCIIPARGGSKRIPDKNIKKFLGKPILQYPISAAIDSKMFDEIMVSTDSNEVMSVARSSGAIVPFVRSEDNSDDYATLADVVEEVLNEYKALGKTFDYVCCILPTAVFVNEEIIKDCFELLITQKADSCRPIVRFNYPIQRALRSKESGLEFFYPEHISSRSQDLEESYHDAGMLYWMTASAGLKGTKKVGYEISELNCHDIDTNEDWKIAEMKYELFQRRI